jgi:hypothetical protein
MATPEPADVRMRTDLATAAVEEVAIRVEEFVREREEEFQDQLTLDVYRLLGRLAEAVGHLAVGVELIERRG